MKTKTFRYLSVMMAALLLLIVEGCQQQTYEVVKPLPTELSMDAAKQYYEATKHRSKAATKYQFLWDLVKLDKIGNAPVVIVPVENIGGGNTLIQAQNGKVSSLPIGSENVIFYYNEKGELTASLVLIDDLNSVATATKSQKAYFRDWITNTLQSIWTLNKGELVQTDRAIDNSRARTSECVIQQYERRCEGAGQLGGGHQYPVWLPNPGEQCYWQYIGSTGCGGGGGTPTNPFPNDPFPLPGQGPFGGGGIGGGGTGGGGIRAFTVQPTSIVAGLLSSVAPHGIYFSNNEIAILNTLPDNVINRVLAYLLDKKDRSIWFSKQTGNFLTGKAFNSEEEKTLKSKGETYYAVNYIIYAANAFAAYKSTEAKFNTDAAMCVSCRGNAYKHALFRIFDAEAFGFDMAKQLGKDHEYGPANGIHTEMDLTNNQAGLDIFVVNPGLHFPWYWEGKVMEALNQGTNMVFVKDGNKVSTSVPE